MNRRMLFLVAGLIVIMLGLSCSTDYVPLTPSEDFEAYYTKINSGEDFEKFSRTGEYADIIVDFGG